MKSINKELKFLINLLKKAGKLSNKKITIYEKDNFGDLVTNLDIEIEEFIIKKIKNKYPLCNIISEEINSDIKLGDDTFVIDPIDGTINFINNIKLWAIQIAHLNKGKVVASIIYMPLLNEIYYADEKHAYLNGKYIYIKKVQVKDALYAIDGYKNANYLVNMEKYSCHRRNFGGVSISMALLASGKIHGAVFKSDKIWDYLPGLHICKMAGAAVENISGFHAAAMDEEFLKILKEVTK